MPTNVREETRMTPSESSRLDLRGTILRSALALAVLFPSLAFAQIHKPIPGPAVCASLTIQYEKAIETKHYTTAQQIGTELIKIGCYKPKPPPIRVKACSAGIKNIATFLQTCPPADPAYPTILHDFSLSFDGTVFSNQQRTQDVQTVCNNIVNPNSSPAPTLKQQAEYTVTQILRTMYYMDNQGLTGCAYPWTGGTSLYAWEKSMLAGVDIRDDSAY